MSTRAYTPEEVRKKLLDQLWAESHYWATTTLHKSATDSIQYRLDGLVFSILTLLDGETLDLPAFDLYPAPHPEDRAYHEAEGENWFDPEVCINDCPLHELWVARKR